MKEDASKGKNYHNESIKEINVCVCVCVCQTSTKTAIFESTRNVREIKFYIFISLHF